MTEENINPIQNENEPGSEELKAPEEIKAETDAPATESATCEAPASEAPITEEVKDVEAPKSPYVYHWDAETKAEVPKKKKGNGTLTFAIIMASAFGIAILCLFLVIFLLPGGGSAESAYSVDELAEMCSQFTVAIETTNYTTSDGVASMSVGTGFILTENGYIITNHHVVENARIITVHTYNGKEYSGKTVGHDESLDLAVIRIHPDGNEKFPVAPIADSSKVKTGEKVIAIGTPSSLDFSWTVTVGYVSKAERPMTMSDGTRQSRIQFDAAVNPGNSGGPLINGNGEVIGIVQMRITDSARTEVYDENGNVIGYTNVTIPLSGIGLAIPISKVMETYERFKDEDMKEPMLGIVGVGVKANTEYFSMGNTFYTVIEENGKKYIAVDYSLVELTAEYLSQGKLITASTDGFLIASVNPDSGAYGILNENDIITSFDGIKLGFEDRDNDGIFTGAADADPYDIVIEILAKKKAGDNVEVEYYRDGKTYTTSIVLVEKN